MPRSIRHALAPSLIAVVLTTSIACSAGSSASGSLAVVSTAPPSPVSVASDPASKPIASPSAHSRPRPTAIPLLGDVPTNELVGPVADRLQGVLDEVVGSGAPDIVAAVITPDGAWSGAAGFVGQKPSPARKDDVFAMASATKPVVAALLLRLAELDTVDLDAPLTTFGLSAEVTNGATIRQALEMRGGLGETDGSVVDRALTDCAHAWTREEVLAAFPDPVATPGNRWFYSNPGYKLVGYAAEKATGHSLATAIRTYVLDPAGVDRMLLQGQNETTPKPWALPIDAYHGPLAVGDYGTGGTLPCLSDSTLSGAGTGMASDAISLARWAWALFAGKVIGAESLATMTEATGDKYGLGIWKFDDFLPDTAYGHAGNKPGYSPIFVVFPGRQIVVALCINDQDADPFNPVRKLLTALDR